jgi:hypothetical protein
VDSSSAWTSSQGPNLASGDVGFRLDHHSSE